MAQAKALDEMVDGRGPIIAIVLSVPEHELVRRLGVRRVCADCGATYGGPGSVTASSGAGRCTRCGGLLVQRDDDNIDVIRQRLRVFTQATEPLVRYYQGSADLRVDRRIAAAGQGHGGPAGAHRGRAGR